MMADVMERRAVVDEIVQKYTKDFRAPSASSEQPSAKPSSSSSSGQCVLVTGATGSLGSHVAAYLAQRPDTHTVVCLNRPHATSTTEPLARQLSALATRGISLSPACLSKLQMLETDTRKPALGLSPETYARLVEKVTHIVHSAWPMSLTRPVRAYEGQFRVFRNLVDLGRAIADRRPAAFRLGFQFVSSLAVVGNYAAVRTLAAGGEALVPEEPATVESAPASGYAKAKLACEHVLRETLQRYPDRFRARAVRIAQISGSTSGGYWKPTEYVPFLIRSSQVLGVLPDLDGTLSWYPVDHVAKTLGELLLDVSESDSDVTPNLIYHVDNPARQSWRDMIATLARALHIPRSPEGIVPYAWWVDRVRRLRASPVDNPALQLIGFFKNHFVPMSCGGLVLDTTTTREHSETMRAMGPVDADLVMKYIAAWRRSGFLSP